MPLFSVLDPYFEHALIQDFPCMLLFNIHFCSCEIQTNSHCAQIFFRVGVRTKKATKTHRQSLTKKTKTNEQ